MTYQELNTIRLHFDLTTEGMAKMIGVSHSAYKNWGVQQNAGVRDQIPVYAQYAVEVLQLLPPDVLSAVMEARGVEGL